MIYEIDSEDLLQPDQCWMLISGVYVPGQLRDGRAYADMPYRELQAMLGRTARWDDTSRTASYT